MSTELQKVVGITLVLVGLITALWHIRMLRLATDTKHLNQWAEENRQKELEDMYVIHRPPVIEADPTPMAETTPEPIIFITPTASYSTPPMIDQTAKREEYITSSSSSYSVMQTTPSYAETEPADTGIDDYYYALETNSTISGNITLQSKDLEEEKNTTYINLLT